MNVEGAWRDCHAAHGEGLPGHSCRVGMTSKAGEATEDFMSAELYLYFKVIFRLLLCGIR